MDHSEAVKEMAAERYLLGELTPDARDAFEAHFFDCPECALDLRAAAAFVDEAKVQLPALTTPLPAPSPARPAALAGKRTLWFLSWRPAFAVPVFAALLLVVGYQNLVTLPALRSEATQPRLLPWVPLHGATRGAAATIAADRQHGVALPIDLSQQPGTDAYASYSFNLLDAQGKPVWTGSIAASPSSDGGDQKLLLAIPGAMLRSGAYTLAVSGIGPHGEHAPLESFAFNLSLAN
jgi:hypothetical protein